MGGRVGPNSPVEADPELLSHPVGELLGRREVEDVDEVAAQVAVVTPPMWSIPEPPHGLLVEALALVDLVFVPQLCSRGGGGEPP